MINPGQFKQKKKRASNPDIVRPNLMTHEKKIKDATLTLSILNNQISKLVTDIEELNRKYRAMQRSIDQLTTYIGNKHGSGKTK